MPLPSGELSGAHIKTTLEGQLRAQVGALAAEGVGVGVALFNANPADEPSRKYVRLKSRAASRIGIAASPIQLDTIKRFPQFLDGQLGEFAYSAYTQGIVLQLPLQEVEKPLTDTMLSLIPPEKDVDNLRPAKDSPFDAATPKAIIRLLEGHHVDLDRVQITVVGLGRLVGAPVFSMLQEQGATVLGVDKSTHSRAERKEAINEAEVVITACGHPASLHKGMFTDLSRQRVVIDAGTAEQSGKIKGDMSAPLRKAALENGWGVTPPTGGVGPLTVISLLSNVVEAAQIQAETAAA